ncbi:MAG TPA: hypothetical protein VL096_21965 [Pirellulaceae bacterium]|nr:hypothetical protein [Pirellulaceae bacterium]
MAILFSAAIATVVAGVTLVICVVATVAGGHSAGVGESVSRAFTIPVMIWPMAFVAALLLSWNDSSHRKIALRRVRKRLLARGDESELEFSGHFPQADPQFIQDVRAGIAKVYDVPVSKIHAADKLEGDLEFKLFAPVVLFFVVEHIAELRRVKLQPYSISCSKTDGIGDLAVNVQRILDQCGRESA